MKIENAVVFITGANRGLGLEFAKQALARGAKKVYAGSRDPSRVTLPGVIPVKLDVNDPDDVAAAAALAGDVTLLINNAGTAGLTEGLTRPGSAQLLRATLETNLFGVLSMTQAFAGTLGRNGGGALLNVLSIVSWISSSAIPEYSITKAAAWSLTNGVRKELREQNTLVVGLHAGFIDTDLTRGFEAQKIAPAEVVRQAYDAIEAGEEEVCVDDATRQVRQGLSQGIYLGDTRAQTQF
ncbi:SDR family oxidoreductase [Pandoraea nosoerga]|uniref:Short-chain dehydrogenase n=1 Tax=Pandoraea nosoerga TaxID=2508296 RepID=A0A5E4SEV9_9BURK|nr:MULTISPECIES: SDR family oxidoreductase [Pandoraea]MBN4666982.1 SDR family oxidoreductase [Pandoraea nosoerga]MBN4674803.1 SDR family oxidoreductase [Pandoraea nosoerga]MBN4681781.1 SDR family oxidoreductase [Pandoraea nosoerga]MBN4744098.1 SDR family oxidoreductase [Pandoraea nosoerga]VVD73014.1 short-chain dehydrogenase [Pandoraea nosoerga]